MTAAQHAAVGASPWSARLSCTSQACFTFASALVSWKW